MRVHEFFTHEFFTQYECRASARARIVYPLTHANPFFFLVSWPSPSAFSDIRGVASAVSGYIGGSTQNPQYREVCEGTTGHAEAVRITFDPAVVSFDSLLDVFFAVHDPTQLNRQGNDVGTQ